MTQKWDLQEVRKLAGIPLTESWDRDDMDDEDPDVKIASSDKRQQAFEKRNKKELSDNAAMLKKRNAEQNATAAAKKEEAKKAEPAKPAEEKKPEPKAAEEKKVDAEDKKEAAAEEKKEEAKRRGRAPNPESFNQKAKAMAKDHTRATFIKWAAEQGKGVAYASAMFAKYNPKSSRAPKETVSEVWMLAHPFMPSYLLAEGTVANQTLWIDPSHPLDPMMFESEAEAERAAKYMQEWKGQASSIVRVAFED